MKHFTLQQRYILEDKLKDGFSLRAIALHLGKSPSALSREVKRCMPLQEYDAEFANKNYLNYRNRGRYAKSVKYLSVIKYYLTKEQYSPEQIVGRMRYKGVEFCSIESVYQLIYDDKANGGTLYQHLRQKRKKRKPRTHLDRRGVLSDRRNIRERPIEADNKSEIGHLEADVVIGTKVKSPVLVTLVDRRSNYTYVGIAKSKSEEHVFKAIKELYERSSFPWRSITFDNGKEFACHKRVEQECNTTAYFADPYSSWQRGANENTNGLLRQYFPKGKTLKEISLDFLLDKENKLNRRPRKKFNFRSPIEFINDDVNNREMCCISI